ncbi:MAG: deoxyribose-phosphate aldolase [Pseudomonadota bacterium]
MNLASYIDHTLLKPEATPKDVEHLCKEAVKHNFAAVCVNPIYVRLCSTLISGSPTGLATVVGFPLGANTSSIKTREAWEAINDGATEIDMVIALGFLKAGRYKEVANDIAEVVRICEDRCVKVIFETALLTKEEIIKACDISISAGAKFVKTSTGFSSRGATLEDIEIMRKAVGAKCKIKASGGIRTRDQALAMIKAGADRIGTSSGVLIVNG